MHHDDSATEPEPAHVLHARVAYVEWAGLPRPPGMQDVRLTIHPLAADLPVRHYLDRPAAQAAPGCALVAVITLGLVNAPDEAQLLDARLIGRRLQVQLALRVFEGRLAANAQRLACAVVELGRPAPGHYDGEIRIDRAVFTDYGHPERARPGPSSRYPVVFEVAGNDRTA